jgi:HD-like signal output (HDOD) protein
MQTVSGIGTSGQPLDLIAEKLRADLIAVFDDPGYRPPVLPTVALEMMALAEREDATIEEIVTLLERDQMLAATVLRLVSSPLYAGRAPIRSLRAAVVRLGVRVIRDVVFEAAIARGVFQVGEYVDTLASVARHSTLTAYITRIVCRRAAIDADLSFICGLLHDVGFAGLLLAVKQVEGSSAPALAAVWPHFDALHERASLLLVQRWGLPEDVVEIVGHHHHLHTGLTARVAAAVRIADHLTEYFGGSVRGPRVNGEFLPGDALEVFDLETAAADLGLDDADIKNIITEAERSLPDIAVL